MCNGERNLVPFETKDTERGLYLPEEEIQHMILNTLGRVAFEIKFTVISS